MHGGKGRRGLARSQGRDGRCMGLASPKEKEEQQPQLALCSGSSSCASAPEVSGEGRQSIHCIRAGSKMDPAQCCLWASPPRAAANARHEQSALAPATASAHPDADQRVAQQPKRLAQLLQVEGALGTGGVSTATHVVGTHVQAKHTCRVACRGTMHGRHDEE